MATMRAALLPAPGEPLRMISREIHEPGPGEVRVKVEACGVCGSDLFLQNGGFGADKLPVVPGHEAAGIVDAVGTGVAGLTPGEQVALYYIDAEPSGDWARAGRENLDPSLRRMGVDVDGALAEYVLRPAHTLIKTAAPIEPARLAVLTDAVATPFHALRLARLKPGERLLVIGIGGIGSNAVQLGRRLGARVTAAGRSTEKLELARTLGAHQTVRLSGQETRDRALLFDRVSDQGFDVVLQCAGSADADQLALAAAGPGGRVILVGASTAPFETRSVDLIWRELTVIGSRGMTRADIAEVIDLYLEGAITVAHLTRRVRPLERVNEALDDLRRGGALRTVIDPQR